MKTPWLLFYTLLLLLTSCNSSINNKAQIAPSNFKQNIEGNQVNLFVLKNKNGLEMTVTNYGARVVSLMVPDKNGNFEDIVLGFDNLDQYLNTSEKYFGACIGRYANRIKNGSFLLNGKNYQLAQNNASNHLHGGNIGFESVIWNVNQISKQKIEMSYVSNHNEEGYPGTLKVIVSYELTDKNEFKIQYSAQTDKATPVNLTHHSFFNLKGAGNGTIEDHILFINADYYTPTDRSLIPTGDIAPLAATPLDFTKPTLIGKRINDNFHALLYGNGYDHNFVLNQKSPKEITLAATVYEPNSGRFMEVYTDEPGIHFYSANFLSGKSLGKNAKPYKAREAFCLETQHFPDSPNKPNFPNTILHPDDTYSQLCMYKFMVK